MREIRTRKFGNEIVSRLIQLFNSVLFLGLSVLNVVSFGLVLGLDLVRRRLELVHRRGGELGEPVQRGQGAWQGE